MPIVRAGLDRLSEVQALVRAAIADAHAHGITHWNDVYPPMEIFLEDIAKGDLFVLDDGGTVQGIMVLTSEKEMAYETVEWADAGGRPLELHRLAVHPDHQRKGVATRLMAFARRYAAGNGFTSLRFDTFGGNHRSLALYDKLGIRRRPGEIRFPRENDGPYHCFEVVIGVPGSDPWLDASNPSESGAGLTIERP